MFKKSEHHMAHAQAGSETIIAQGVKVEGDFKSNGDIAIDGELKGSLATVASLHVGESAVIHAEVSAKNAVIAGTIVGNLHVEDGLQLHASSNVTGDIVTSRLLIAEAAVVNGRISMNGKE